MRHTAQIFLIAFFLVVGCSEKEGTSMLDSDENELMLIKHGLSRIEMAQMDKADLEVGVFLSSDELIAFSLSKSGAVSMVRKSYNEDSRSVLVVDEDGDGYPDFELQIDSNNERITKTFLQIKRGSTEVLSDGKD